MQYNIKKMTVYPLAAVVFFLLLSAQSCSQPTNTTNNQSSQNNTSSTVSNNNSSNSSDLKAVYTADEVAKHNNQSDCWLIVDGKVYDVTDSISSHPGGPQAIIPNCGKDATTAFQTQNKPEPRNHPEQAYSNLDSMLIGELSN